MRNQPLLFRLLLLLLSVCLVSACSTSTKTPLMTNSTPHAPTKQLLPALPDATAAEQQGDFEGAARLYLAAAKTNTPPQRHDYQLKAIKLLLQGNYIDRANRLATALADENLTNNQENRLILLSSQISLAQQNPDKSLQLLDTVLIEALDRTEKKLYFQLKAEAYLQLQQPENTFLNLSQALLMTDDDTEYAAIENRIWNILIKLSQQTLDNLRPQINSTEDAGWLDLATIYNSHSALSSRIDIQLVNWQAQYPQHPATPELLNSINALQGNILFKPQIIAVLLPQSGTFSKAADAIKTGLIAAFMTHSDSEYTPALRFYDSGELTDQTMTAYDQAVKEGAKLIIGPLSKDNVAALAKRESLPVPTLALNNIQLDKVVDNLYLFGLSPEDEAQQAAERAWLDGYNRALTLTPNGNWGERLNSAFKETWGKFGGKTNEQQQFDPTTQDFSQPLQALLNLDESRARIRAIKQLLGNAVNAEPRRRQDVDLIFLAAQPQQARQIRPQLKFFYAESIPIYATSHLYTGIPNPQTDHDMNDILFCDMPWVIEDSPLWQNIMTHWPNQAPTYKRLYALGIDSFNIITHLRRLSAYKFQQFSGQTGMLSLDDQQNIKRQLLWAKFVNGKVVRVNSSQTF